MRIGNWTIFEKAKQPEPVVEAVTQQPRMEAHYGGGTMRTVYAFSYDGEKNLGELGPAKHYLPDYGALRIRSWQLFLESEICQIVFKKYSRWVIGSGLKLQAEPLAPVLESEKITFDLKDFDKVAEARFKVYSNSKRGDYAGMRSVHKLAKKAFIDAIVGGDVLVVLRYIDNAVTVQLIDGAHLCNPTATSYKGGNLVYGNNRVKNGVELDERGQHVAYHVKGKDYKTERIPAKIGKHGITQAFLIYGLEYRIDDVRGIPLISAIMETAKKLERYKEATVGSAEERQKVIMVAEHEKGTSGEHPMLTRQATASGYLNSDLPKTITGQELADSVIATTNKQFINLPPGAKLATVDSKNELYFESFMSKNIDLVCATVGIPPNVAMGKYDDNFSASRAGLKDWEHNMNVERNDFVFYQNIYNFWLFTEILGNKIQAPGYLESLMKGNYMAVEAYQNARWVGVPVPHIDPVKEVAAQRAMLGKDSENIPLTTVEAATEALNNGDANTNIEQYGKEIAFAGEHGIEKVAPQVLQPNNKEDVPDE